MKPSRSNRMVLGVDVGTGSVRAGVFDLAGRMHGYGASSIRTWNPSPDFLEQSSEDIWRACGKSVRLAVRQAGATPDAVRGICFDATCSLVCLDANDQPVTVSPTGRAQQNVILWADHRAVPQVEQINATDHPALKYVGGTMSPEMEPPKLLWLKEHLPRSWKRAVRFMDLADFLTYRSTATDVRSLCTTVCKWAYAGHQRPAGETGGDTLGTWDDSFLRRIGLSDLTANHHARIGRTVRPMGEPVGAGLTPAAARELGLVAGTAVGVGIIDAHAGGLGMLGARVGGRALTPTTANRRLALIGGTSNCHMAVSTRPRFVPGVWGPYYSAMVPGLWLNEGGQSAAGSLIDHVINSSRHASALHREADRRGGSVHQLLNDRLDALAGRLPVAMLTSRRHVLGDHHGNRSPRADPMARGTASGLTLGDTVDELALSYLATIQAVAYGTRHIIDRLNARGYAIDSIFMCGGGTKNPLFLREHADATGCTIRLPREREAVLLGAAVLAAVACSSFADCASAMAAMTACGSEIRPAKGRVRRYHDRKFTVNLRMYEDQRRYDSLMGSFATRRM